MKNFFKNNWIKLLIIFIIIAIIVACVIIFWPKKTSKNVMDLTNDITTSNYVVSSKEYQVKVIDYVKNTYFENSHQIDEVYLENLNDYYIMYNSYLENIETLNNYVLYLDKKEDKDYLNYACKELNNIKKSLKNNFNDLNNNYNLIINYTGSDNILYQVATNKLKNFIKSIENELLLLNEVQNILVKGSLAINSNNSLYSTVVNNKIAYLNAIANKINDNDIDYSIYKDSLKYYKTIFVEYFNKDFDYKNYYDNKDLKLFVNLSKDVELSKFYNAYKTAEFEPFTNTLSDVNKKIYLDFASYLESFYNIVSGEDA